VHSIFLGARSYGLQDGVDSIVFNKDRLPLSNHENHLLEIALQAFPHRPETTWMNEQDRDGGMCFKEAYSSTLTARFATNQQDGSLLRSRAFDYFGFDMQECPPAKTIILHRSGEKRRREITNEEELIKSLKKLGVVDIERATISHLNSSLEQAYLFNQAGLLISPHGSELVNIIFSQPKAALIEVTPTIFNFDFAQMGIDLGNPLWFSIGGTPSDMSAPPPEIDKCNQLFKNCVGEPRCCRQKEKDSVECAKPSNGNNANNKVAYSDYAKTVKHLNFAANVKAFERVVKEMIKTLNRACAGHWPGVSL